MLEMFSKHIRLYSLPKSLFLKRWCKDNAQQKAAYGIQSEVINMVFARTEEGGASFSSAGYHSLGPWSGLSKVANFLSVLVNVGKELYWWLGNDEMYCFAENAVKSL